MTTSDELLCETCGDRPCEHFLVLADSLDDKIRELAQWAQSRIDQCRAQETKFGAAWTHREKHSLGPPQALVEAWTERRALQAVLDMLAAPPSSVGGPK